MKLKNSPGALAAIGRAQGHIAKARLELKQASSELRQVRGLEMLPDVFTDAGLARFLDDASASLRRHRDAPEGLRLISETPELDAKPGLQGFLGAVNEIPRDRTEDDE